MVLAAAGWLLMVPPGGYVAGGAPMGVAQFLVAFTLVTMAFPFGRGICLSMVGKLLGDTPQGGWMGVMFALGSIARIAGPFWAVHGYEMGPLVVFGVTAVGFIISLAVVRALWNVLAYAPAATRQCARRDSVAPPYLSPVATPYSPSLSSMHDDSRHADEIGEMPPMRLPVSSRETGTV